MPFEAGAARIGAREDAVEVGDAAVRDPRLAAVDPPAAVARGSALVRRAAASDPASGSDSANAAIASPRATRGSHSARSASEPPNVIAPEPSPCMAKAKSASASCAARASRRTHNERDSTVSSAPPHAAGTL